VERRAEHPERGDERNGKRGTRSEVRSSEPSEARGLNNNNYRLKIKE
jgi:hypothetical protein